MALPSGLAYALAVVMVAVSVYCVSRLVLASRMGRRLHYDANVAHVLMGAAMAGMLVPRWRLLPVGTWEAVFAVVGAYFLVLCAWRIARPRAGEVDDDYVRHLPHSGAYLVMVIAMLYMLSLAVPRAGATAMSMSMSGPGRGLGSPGIALLLVVVLVASAIWQLDGVGRLALEAHAARVVGGADALGGERPPDATRQWLAPRLEISCHVAMCLAMGYMLVLMI